MSTVAHAIETALAPADALRRAALRRLGPRLRPLIADRERRVAVTAVVAILVALLGASLFPLWLLALGPVILGVPHLVADARYLVMRPGLHRRLAFWPAMLLPVVLARWG